MSSYANREMPFKKFEQTFGMLQNGYNIDFDNEPEFEENTKKKD